MVTSGPTIEYGPIATSGAILADASPAVAPLAAFLAETGRGIVR
jgi:hypothetical protein